MELDIQNKLIVTSNTVSKIGINVKEYILNQSVTCLVYFYSNDKIVDVQEIKIEGDEFITWGNDDNYLIDLILYKVGAERII